MMNKQLARRNMRFGVSLFILLIVLVVGAFAYAAAYKAFVG